MTGPDKLTVHPTAAGPVLIVDGEGYIAWDDMGAQKIAPPAWLDDYTEPCETCEGAGVIFGPQPCDDCHNGKPILTDRDGTRYTVREVMRSNLYLDAQTLDFPADPTKFVVILDEVTS